MPRFSLNGYCYTLWPEGSPAGTLPPAHEIGPDDWEIVCTTVEVQALGATRTIDGARCDVYRADDGAIYACLPGHARRID